MLIERSVNISPPACSHRGKSAFLLSPGEMMRVGGRCALPPPSLKRERTQPAAGTTSETFGMTHRVIQGSISQDSAKRKNRTVRRRKSFPHDEERPPLPHAPLPATPSRLFSTLLPDCQIHTYPVNPPCYALCKLRIS